MIIHQFANSYTNYNYNSQICTNNAWDSHFHGNYELLYSIDGSTSVITGGISEILTAGEMLLIPPYTIHSLKVDDRSHTWIGVFSEDFITTFADKNRFLLFSKFRCDEEIENYLKKFLFNLEKPDLYLHKSCLYSVCRECLKNSVILEKKQYIKFTENVIEYVREHLSEEITASDVSAKLGFERHYFSKIFHDYFSINFKEFINIFRFEQACRLLNDKKKDITQIAEECGFGSIRNFNLIFHKFSGITPSQYRRQNQ